jgi:hypothetical protein
LILLLALKSQGFKRDFFCGAAGVGRSDGGDGSDGSDEGEGDE